MSPFPQSVANSSAFSMVFLVPSPVAIVLRIPKNLKRPRWIRGLSVLKQVSVAVSDVQKCSFVVGDQCRRYVCKKRKQK